MGKIEFVKINGRDVVFIDELSPDFSHVPIAAVAQPAPFHVRCACEMHPGDLFSVNEKGEIIPSNGRTTMGVVVKVNGNSALVSIKP